MVVSAFNEIPLRLTLAYHGDRQNNITSCSFSNCGRFFAFVDEPQIVLGYSVNDLLSVCLDENNFKPSPTSHCQISNLLSDESNNTQSLNLHTDCTDSIINWKALTSELLNGDSLPINMKPIFRIKTNGNVISMTFAAGDSSFCRLPHRAEKRRSSIVREPRVSLLLLGLSSGVIEVYNVSSLISSSPHVPKCVLMDESTLVYLLSAATDGSLRIGSVHQGGEVRLWDLWDDGNMYGKLRHKFTIPTSPILNNQSCCEIQGEVCTFAWHPFGKHVFLAGERGHAVVLDAESPFSRIAYIRSGHYHRISVAKYSKDGSLLITASYDSCCAVWSVPEYQCLHRFWHMGREPSIPLRGGSNGHHIYGLSLSPDDLYFITICEDRCIRLWPLAPVNSPLKIYFELALQSYAGFKFRSLAFSPCGRIVAVTTNNHDVLLFTTRSESIRLSTQCLHIIRKCIMNNILNQFIYQPTKQQYLSLSSITMNNDKTLFQYYISQLHLPSPVIKIILRNFVN
ncbi:hypothetical protein MN116_007333 [Schistosoma mekongi]|uniref:WD repeat and SOCS box-containing protein 1 n=1 Tax=Schistosoma mekongi TaxID=38744 RepID=A0AAE1Z909_SCHME|nr:hypothetical protein MN116_007333 [Schistosoma mekongi]